MRGHREAHSIVFGQSLKGATQSHGILWRHVAEVLVGKITPDSASVRAHDRQSAQHCFEDHRYARCMQIRLERNDGEIRPGVQLRYFAAGARRYDLDVVSVIGQPTVYIFRSNPEPASWPLFGRRDQRFPVAMHVVA